MWDCEHCGCQAIAGTITVCPMCFTPRNEDVAAGSSVPAASAPASAAVGVRETPQPPADPEIGAVLGEEDWGLPDGKDH